MELINIQEYTKQLDSLAEAMLKYIEVTFMIDIQTTPAGRMLLTPVQKEVDTALRSAGYGPHLNVIYKKYGVRLD